MIDEKDIEEAFDIYYSEFFIGGKGHDRIFNINGSNPKCIDVENVFKAGANWAMEEMKKESIFSKMSTEKIEEMIERGEDEF